MSDDRVVLPLTATRRAAVALCEALCEHHPDHPARHCDVCLTPLLTEHDRRLTEPTPALGLSPDCADPVKHRSCPACSCACHLGQRP